MPISGSMKSCTLTRSGRRPGCHSFPDGLGSQVDAAEGGHGGDHLVLRDVGVGADEDVADRERQVDQRLGARAGGPPEFGAATAELPAIRTLLHGLARAVLAEPRELVVGPSSGCLGEVTFRNGWKHRRRPRPVPRLRSDREGRTAAPRRCSTRPRRSHWSRWHLPSSTASLFGPCSTPTSPPRPRRLPWLRRFPFDRFA